MARWCNGDQRLKIPCRQMSWTKRSRVSSEHLYKPRLGSTPWAAGQGLPNCFLIVSMSSFEGGQFVSHVLQCRMKESDCNAPSNSSLVTLNVKLWLFGQTVSSLARSLLI